MKNLIAINGKMGAGKTEVASWLGEKYDFQVISIGTAIKKTCALLVDASERGQNQTFHDYLSRTIGDARKTDELFGAAVNCFRGEFESAVWEKDENGEYLKNQWYRRLTQDIAAMFRSICGNEIWVKFLVYDAFDVAKMAAEGKRIVCDDLREPEEKAIFENVGFHTIRLDVSKEVQKERLRKRGYGAISEELLNHYNETALDEASFDCRFDTSLMALDEVRGATLSYIANQTATA